MDQGWVSIHRKKDLFPLKPPLTFIHLFPTSLDKSNNEMNNFYLNLDDGRNYLQ